MSQPGDETTAPRPVLAAFPEYERQVRALVEVDPDFADLCDDYDAVVDSYRRGAAGEQSLADAVDEYHGLRLELESEILELLRRTGAPGGRS